MRMSLGIGCCIHRRDRNHHPGFRDKSAFSQLSNTVKQDMFKVIVVLLVGLSSLPSVTPCAPLYAQCGGKGWGGATQCCAGGKCQAGNEYYSQCVPGSAPAPAPPAPAATTPAPSNPQPVAPTNNLAGRQNGVTTRYWDCCKSSCAWAGKASVSSPVKTCARDGTSTVDVNAQSGCNGGGAYVCHDQQPWAVNDNLAYGFAAATVAGQRESDWCCTCYSLIFTSGPVAGKEFVVQVTNSGGDLGSNHFDLQIPGGGFGLFDGCSSQYPGSYAWGQRYGGVSQRSDCSKLPAAVQQGCLWRFDWFKNADNPSMSFKPVACPAALTAKTGCVRK